MAANGPRPSRSICLFPGRPSLGPISLFAGFGFSSIFIDNGHGTACYRNIGATNIYMAARYTQYRQWEMDDTCHATPLPLRSAQVPCSRNDCSVLSILVANLAKQRVPGYVPVACPPGNVGGRGGLLSGTRYSNYSLLQLRLFKSSGNVVGPKTEVRFRFRRHSEG